MRYFVFIDNNGNVTGSLATMGVPGDGGPNGRTVPPNAIEVEDEATRSTYADRPGYRYQNNTWTAPTVHPVLDLRSFFMLFTPAEVAAMNVARTGGDAEIDYFWTLLTLGQSVNLGHPLVTAGLSMMVAKNLLTQERANQISAGTPPPS